jgi:hypothetical protein
MDEIFFSIEISQNFFKNLLVKHTFTRKKEDKIIFSGEVFDFFFKKLTSKLEKS